MAQQITPIAPSLPATTAIQDPAARRFAQAVQDALSALKSEAGAVESLNKAAAALAGAAGGTPAGIAQWLLTSELYQKLKTEIVAVDVQAKQDLLAEAVARQGAIEQIQAILASIEATPDYDPLATYAVGDMVIYDSKLYRALLETTGNLPTNITYWEKIGDYASLGEVVSAHALAINDLEYNMLDPAGVVQAEVAARQTLATQMCGAYAGTDITQVTQGLMYAERVARSGADSAEVAARQSLATKVLGQSDPTGLTLATLTSGLIFEEAQVRSDADGSLAQTIDALEVTMGQNIEAAILGEQTVRATNDAALVTAINTAWAFTGATQAVSQSGQNLITNWTAAQANRWSQLDAEVFTAGGKTIRAALSEEANTRATLAGQVSATWTVKAEVDSGTGKPYIAGLALGASGQGGATTSEFIIRADALKVVMPGYGEHVPFAIGPSGAEFTGLTSWSNVQGDGRPENGATVGADDSNYTGSRGNNLLRNSMLKDSTAGWGHALGPGCVLGEFRTALNENGAPKGYGAIKLGFSGTASSVYESQIYCSDLAVPCVPGERMELGARVGVYRGDAQLTASFLLSDGSFMLYVPVTGGVSEATNQTAWTQNLSDLQHLWGFVTVPANAVKCYMEVRVKRTTTAGSTDLYVALPYIGKAGAAQTTHSPWNQGVFITPSEITTWIANAAIGNAQIGGDIYSSTWDWNNGWLLQKTGNLYCANAYVRGNVEASSLKADTAMVNRANIVNAAVDTLQIQGNAVTIPVHSRLPLVYVTAGGWTSLTTAWINAEGNTVSIFASASVSTTTVVSAQNVSIRVLSPSGVQLGRNVTSLRDGLYSPTFLITSSTEAGTYTLQIYKSGPTSTLSVEDISLFLIGTKR